MTRGIAAPAFTALLLLVSTATAQDFNADARRMLERADVKRAFDHVDAHKDQILAEWIALTEINAPSGKERERAEAVRKAAPVPQTRQGLLRLERQSDRHSQRHRRRQTGRV